MEAAIFLKFFSQLQSFYVILPDDKQNEGYKTAMNGLIRRVMNLYVEGFRSMTVGRSLWTIIIIKLFIMFAILKLFFFPNLLDENYDTDAERANAVATELIKR